MLMIHHNVIEHLPDQLRHPIGKRYILENSPQLLAVLRRYGVKLVFTGHLHIQDVAYSQGVYDITTGSLVSYPHPYRVLEFKQDNYGRQWLEIISHRIETVPDFPNLQHLSRQWMGDRSFPFIVKLLTQHPLNLPLALAEKLAPGLRDFWANIADGDALLDYPQFPPSLRRHIQTYGVMADGVPTFIDNHSSLLLGDWN
jgi:hypothetical protein